MFCVILQNYHHTILENHIYVSYSKSSKGEKKRKKKKKKKQAERFQVMDQDRQNVVCINKSRTAWST